MALRCQDITIKHGRGNVLANFNLELSAGQIIALYGSTGSGKTSLLLLLAGLLKPSVGEVFVEDINVLKDPRRARLQTGLGVIPEFNPLLSHLSVEENLTFQARALKLAYPKDHVCEMIQNFRLEKEAKRRVDRLPALKYTETGMAMALIGNPALVLLDEPEYHLTTEETVIIWKRLQTLKSLGKTVILTTRHQEVAAQCDQVVFMPSGKVVSRHELSWNSYSRA
ncbi:ATP-binding cassette domain-containing protein [Desulfosporosinus metallidurans]|uniref:ABC transporter, ATP-binding protein n=1 Tax=Desulfosporosinus metallidurans TaxID=1888891 RepID=A0A1Q8QL68_9FIRM|nr:ATP-binding cassette domain-containing protein [Desulfosporosinus metallidurans]OLN28083.1 ABC transporter, ATP-binding protein [Desulfosporosinus metallidurans]